MKIVVFILTIVAITALSTGAVLAIALAAPEHALGLLVAAAGLAIVPPFYGPLVLGSLATYFDPRSSPESQRIVRRWTIGVVLAQVVSGVGLIAILSAMSASLLPAAGIIPAGVLLTALSLPIGAALRRRDARSTPTVARWQPLTRAEAVGKIRRIAITFVIAAVAVLAILLVLFAVFVDDDGSRPPVAMAIGYPLIMGSLAAGLATVVVGLPITRQLRETGDGDLGRIRRFSRAVLKGRTDKLRDGEEPGAARYAATLAVSQRFQIAFLFFLYVGIGGQQLTALLAGIGDPLLPAVLLGSLLVMLIVIVPLMVRQVRRASAYARDRAELLDDRPSLPPTSPPTTP